MGRYLFVNLPVGDLPRSMEFYKALGFEFEPKFTSEQGAGMIISENSYAMLLTREFFQTFIPGKTISDATTSTEVLVCISCNSKAEVDELVAKAVAAGGRIPRPSKDHGFMYEHAFEDLDGHIWELAYMEQGAEG